MYIDRYQLNNLLTFSSDKDKFQFLRSCKYYWNFLPDIDLTDFYKVERLLLNNFERKEDRNKQQVISDSNSNYFIQSNSNSNYFIQDLTPINEYPLVAYALQHKIPLKINNIAVDSILVNSNGNNFLILNDLVENSKEYFRSLTTLDISITYSNTIESLVKGEKLFKLPINLKHLIIRLKHDYFYNNIEKSIDMNKFSINFDTAPKLEWFEFDSYDKVNIDCRNMTSVKRMTLHLGQGHAILPESVINLDLDNAYIDSFSNIIKLTIDNSDHDSIVRIINSLASTLEELNIKTEGINQVNYDYLPKLRKLSFTYVTYGKMPKFRFPKKLEYLYLFHINGDLELPKELNNLCLVNVINMKYRTELPIGLKVLKISGHSRFLFNSSDTLEHLYINSILDVSLNTIKLSNLLTLHVESYQLILSNYTLSSFRKLQYIYAKINNPLTLHLIKSKVKRIYVRQPVYTEDYLNKINKRFNDSIRIIPEEKKIYACRGGLLSLIRFNAPEKYLCTSQYKVITVEQAPKVSNKIFKAQFRKNNRYQQPKLIKNRCIFQPRSKSFNP